MKCCWAHGLQQLWSCSDEWNVIRPTALLSKMNHNTNQMLSVVYLFVVCFQYFCGFDWELKWAPWQKWGLLLSCLLVLWIMNNEWYIFVEAEGDRGGEMCLFLSGLFSALQESRTGRDSACECQWHFQSLCLFVSVSHRLSLTNCKQRLFTDLWFWGSVCVHENMLSHTH